MSERAVRPEQTEQACFKYGAFIEKGLTTKSFIVTKREFPGDVKSARTFQSRFTDARTGFERYEYVYGIINHTSYRKLKYIKATILADGSVEIINTNLSSPSPVLFIEGEFTEEEMKILKGVDPIVPPKVKKPLCPYELPPGY